MADTPQCLRAVLLLFLPPRPDFWEYAALSEAILQVSTEKKQSSGHKLRIGKSSLLRV